MNLLQTMMGAFDENVLGLLGAVLGEHEVKVRDGIQSAVPEVLSGIADKVSSDEGRSMLWRELRDTTDEVATKFPQQLHYQNSQKLVEQGNHQLAGILGADAAQITERVSHAADIGSTSAQRIVGAVTPLIFSKLAAQQATKNYSAANWGDLFEGQAQGLREKALAMRNRNAQASEQQKLLPTFGGGDSNVKDESNNFGSDGGTNERSGNGVGGAALAGGAAAGLAAAGFAAGNRASKDADDKAADWSAGSGFTPGYSNTIDSKFDAKPKDVKTTGTEADSTHDSRRVERQQRDSIAVKPKLWGAADAASTSSAAAATSAAGGTAAGAAASAVGAKALSGSKATSSSGPTSGSAAGSVKTTSGDSSGRWVPDAENLRREREKTAIEATRSQREARIQEKKSGGWFSWLWWQALLVGGLVAGGFYVADQMKDKGADGQSELSGVSGAAADDDLDAQTATSDEPNEAITGLTSEEAATAGQSNGVVAGAQSSEGATDAGSNEAAAGDGSNGATTVAGSNEGANDTDAKQAETSVDEDQQTEAEKSSPLVSSLKSGGPSGEKQGGETDSDSTTQEMDNKDQQPELSPAQEEPPKLEAATPEETAAPDLKVPDAPKSTPAAADVVIEDVDFAVETVLEKLDTGLSEVNDKASAESFLPELNDGVSSLEGLLDTRGQWSVSDDVTVGIQLKEAKKKFAGLQSAAFEADGVKEILADSLSNLEELLQTKEQPK